jgi:TolA-binding protein
MEGRFDRIDASIERLSESLERLKSYTMELRQETMLRFDVLEHRMDILAATSASIEARMAPLTKSVLDSGSQASQFLREQARTKEMAAGLAERLARVEEKLSKLVDPAA